MKKIFFGTILLLITLGSLFGSDYVSKVTQVRHPRILLFQGEEETILQAIGRSSSLAGIHQTIVKTSDTFLSKPLLERKLEGFRLLDVSREVLRRIFFLSYAYRTTGNSLYAERAEKELLAVSAFSDWHPPHFLGVSEMALGVSIGYDWLYSFLSFESKQLIENALLTKALMPSLESRYADRFNNPTNWSQVCNTGVLYAALAIADKNPDIAEKVLNRSIELITIPMKSYDPDGAFAEGYMYWQYGTVFNIFMLDALQKLGINDLKIKDFKGFARTSIYLQHMVGTSGKSFNYMDCIPNSILNPSQFWFASQLNDPSLLWVEKAYIDQNRFFTLTDGNGLPLEADQLTADKFNQFSNDRTLPALLLWGKNIDFNQIEAPKTNCYIGHGVTPVCLMRTSWNDKNGIYLGFKAGSAGANHGHMDVGSFVIDADGERWASDFGMQNYNSLESKGINLWNLSQESTRWNVFRYNNLAHNTITVNNRYQQVTGKADIVKHGFDTGFLFAVSDLTQVYDKQLKAVNRGAAIINQQYVLIQDEIQNLSSTDTIRWTVLTEARVKITDKKAFSLTLNGKQMLVRVDTNVPFKLKTWSTQSHNDYDESNEGKTLFGFELIMRPGSNVTIGVRFIPQSQKAKPVRFNKPLQNWR